VQALRVRAEPLSAELGLSVGTWLARIQFDGCSWWIALLC